MVKIDLRDFLGGKNYVLRFLSQMFRFHQKKVPDGLGLYIALIVLSFLGKKGTKKGPKGAQKWPKVKFFKFYKKSMLVTFQIFYMKLQQHKGLKLTCTGIFG